MFERQVDTSKRINLLYDDVERHHVIANLTAPTVRKYVCKCCHKSCGSDVTHACYQTCSDCLASPPCAFSDFGYPWAKCIRHVRSRSSYDKHKLRTMNKKYVCERNLCPSTYRWAVTPGKNDFNKRFCNNCKQNKEIGGLCYMRPLKEALPSQVIRWFTFSTISRPPKIPSTRTRLSYTYLISSVCSSSVHGARTWKP